MKRFLFFILLCVSCISAQAQNQVVIKCPDCGHDITIDISVGGSAVAIHSLTSNPEEFASKDVQQQAAQCKGITAKGTRCSRKAQANSDYCWQHANKASTTTSSNLTSGTTTTPKTSSSSSGGRCRATTKSGSRCSRTARSNGYCWQHGG